MFRLILIDDERFTLDILSQLIEWQKYGFELSGTFTDPYKALDFIKREHIDAVITDISMPKMSGIELTREIRKIYSDIRIVYLTAYSEFEYAQKAIEFNVSSYILKPLDADVLSDTLKKLYHELKSSVLYTKTLSYDANVAKNAISEFFSEKPPVNPQILYQSLLKCNLQINENSSCAILEIKIDNLDLYLNSVWKYGIMRLYSSIDRLCEQEGLYIIPMIYSFDTIKLFAVEKTGCNKTFTDLIMNFENSFIADCSDILSLSVQFKISSVFRNISNINIINENNIFNAATVLFNSVKKETDKSAKRTSVPYDFSNYSNEEKKLIAEIMILKFAQYCEGDALNEISIMLNELSKQSNHDKTNEIFRNVLQRIYAYFNTTSNYDETIINKCKEYIKKNYNLNISLRDVAEHVHLSEAHLSRLFKSVTKKKYIDYLNEVRIENAKSLLTFSDVKIKDIAIKSGYGSYPYFLRVFKTYTGMTPVEYKDKYHKN